MHQHILSDMTLDLSAEMHDVWYSHNLLDFVEIIGQLTLPNDPRVLPQYTGKYVRFMITAVAISYHNIMWALYEVLHKNRKIEIITL